VSLPKQSVFPGVLTGAWNEALQKIRSQNSVARLWAKDASWWPAEKHQVPIIESNLRWLDLPEQIETLIAHAVQRAAAARKDGFDHLVFVSMGSSTLANAASVSLSDPSIQQHLHLLDSVDPDAVRRLEAKLPLERTLFIFASKSGKRIETHALLLYFLGKLKAAGIAAPGKHFVAFTEQGSYLATLAKEYKFRDAIFDQPGILGRYSGLIHFSLFQTGISRLDEASLLETILAMKKACSPSTPLADNPAATLAAFLAAGMREGFQKLVLLTGDELGYFAYRIAHLVSGSTTGNGYGLLAIFPQPSYAPQTLQKGSLVVSVTMKGQTQVPLQQSQQLCALDIPLVEIQLQSPVEFAAEIFKWEIATALACLSLGVNCFHDAAGKPNLAAVSEQLENFSEKRQRPLPAARVKEDGIALYAQGETRRSISTLDLRSALQTFLELRDAGGYLAVCPFFEVRGIYCDLLRPLRDRMRHQLGIPVMVASGPRYLYSLGKIFKTGPANGMFIIITAEPAEDICIPGAGYTLGQLQLAFALTEGAALEDARKATIRLHLSQGPEKGLKQFSDVVIQAMAQIRGGPG
jgi:transaldolase / glucose-6-phosphate isomerase